MSAPIFTTHNGRILTGADVRAVLMAELRRWAETWPSVVGTLDQRRAVAKEIVESVECCRASGSVARPVLGDVVLDFIVGRFVGTR